MCRAHFLNNIFFISVAKSLTVRQLLLQNWELGAEKSLLEISRLDKTARSINKETINWNQASAIIIHKKSRIILDAPNKKPVNQKSTKSMTFHPHPLLLISTSTQCHKSNNNPKFNNEPATPNFSWQPKFKSHQSHANANVGRCQIERHQTLQTSCLTWTRSKSSSKLSHSNWCRVWATPFPECGIRHN